MNMSKLPTFVAEYGIRSQVGSVTRKKSPNVHKSCIKMISLEK